MFTGLIEAVGVIASIQKTSNQVIFTIDSTPTDNEPYALGESIAVNGVCLTVTEFGPTHFKVLAGAETLERTTLGRLQHGGRVNLERAMRVGDRFGGHMVSGHVDGIGRIAAKRDFGANLEFDIRAESGLAHYCVTKGSITVNGISLTLNKVVGPILSVALIPHTVSATTLAAMGVGDLVNLEVDMIAKYVEKYVEKYAEKLLPGDR